MASENTRSGDENDMTRSNVWKPRKPARTTAMIPTMRGAGPCRNRKATPGTPIAQR